MKQKLQVLLAVFSFTIMFGITAQASHIVGAYISYEYVSANQYRFKMKLYRDCSGITAPTSITLDYYSKSLAIFNGIINLTLDTSFAVQPNVCVPIGLTTCQGGTAYGFEEYSFSSNPITLPGMANDWVFTYNSCCRNSAITSLASGGGESLYTQATLDNLSYSINSSPQFNNTIFNEYCAGVFTNVDYSATDPDGDSLVYSLVPCWGSVDTNGNGVSVGYAIPYTPLNFIASFTPITINSSSGIVSFTPSMISINVVSIQIDEYRNGVKIGSIKRDDEIVIVNGIQNPDIIYGNIFLDANANAVLDSGEVGINSIVTETQAGNLFSSSNAFGDYSAYVIPGSYTVSIPYLPPYYNVTPASYSPSFIVLGLGDSTNNFALTRPPGVTDLRVNITGLSGAIPNTDRYYSVEVTNAGTDTIGGNLDVTFDSQFAFVNANPVNTGLVGNTVSWTIAPMLPTQHNSYVLVLHLDSAAVIGSNVTNVAMVTPTLNDTTPGDNLDSLIQTVVYSCDPNYKEVSPSGYILPQFVANQDWLEYTIHFQNTGTAPAMNINLKDPLDMNLAIGSFEMLASSHPCSFNIGQQGLLNVDFANINLPDWNTNEPASHGFFKYRIKPKSTLMVGNQIINAANIFFDANPAVTTNTTITIVNDVTAMNEIVQGDIGALIYPNPSTGTLNIHLEKNTTVTIELLDMTGRMMLKANSNKSISLDISKFYSGLYIYRIYDSKGASVIGKIIKE